MAYSIINIVNRALGSIGQSKIDSIDEDSTPANQARLEWDEVRDEVLAADDWTFAKTRVALAKNTTDPVQGFDYAYTLPADFLRMCQQKKSDPTVSPNHVSRTRTFGYIDNRDYAFDYVIEALDNGTLCLFTNYDNTAEDLVIRYIRREENPARYSAHFISALVFRLAAALAPVLTSVKSGMEDKSWTLYNAALIRAKGHDKSGDYVPDETGNDDWLYAGR